MKKAQKQNFQSKKAYKKARRNGFRTPEEQKEVTSKGFTSMKQYRYITKLGFSSYDDFKDDYTNKYLNILTPVSSFLDSLTSIQDLKIEEIEDKIQTIDKMAYELQAKKEILSDLKLKLVGQEFAEQIKKLCRDLDAIMTDISQKRSLLNELYSKMVGTKKMLPSILYNWCYSFV